MLQILEYFSNSYLKKETRITNVCKSSYRVIYIILIHAVEDSDNPYGRNGYDRHSILLLLLSNIHAFRHSWITIKLDYSVPDYYVVLSDSDDKD